MAPPRQKLSHTVAPGDHMSRVAAVNGFRSYVPLSEEPGNKPLMQLRRTPHILGVGDAVEVPPLETREVERSTDQRHRFHATIPELVVRAKHLTWAGAPVAAPTTATGDGKPLVVLPGAEGTFSLPVAPLTDRVQLTGTNAAGAQEQLLRVGFLEPIATLAGARQRLTNLGYEAGEKDDPASLQLRSAIEEFQCDQHMVVDGVVGPDTRARLVKVHGC